MGAGRPTKYCKEVVENALYYFDHFEDNGDVVPSIEGLAEHLKLGRQTLYDWKGDEGKEEFTYILEIILSKQARLSINKGLTGDFNPTMAKLLLGKHGYHDKVDSSLSGSIENPLTLVIKEISGNTLGPTSD